MSKKTYRGRPRYVSNHQTPKEMKYSLTINYDTPGELGEILQKISGQILCKAIFNH